MIAEAAQAPAETAMLHKLVVFRIGMGKGLGITHIDHSIDALRQHEVCAADVTPNVFQYSPSDFGIRAMANVVHECRDFDKFLRLIEQQFSALSVDENGLDVREPDVQFNPAHLIIPDPDRLVIDLEALIEYFHLVICGYFECLFCGSQRSNIQAAQQHMIGKGHCKIDVSSQGSEYRDFYEFESSSGDDTNIEYKTERSKSPFVDIDKTMRLPSGKVLSHRMQARARVLRPGAPAQTETATTSSTYISTSSTAEANEDTTPRSNRVAKREAVSQTQLATLRDSDRKSLMHLPVAQQRAIVMRGKKQIEQARRDENEMLLKIQLKANRSLKK
ncbi:C2H2 type zinc-finger (2 copies) domain-containing protein [Hirsutella rhossiliensis]|uniref:C2H2 type zinc-finger (2 copies) domain-containing protein n=1 Tax=Hirsutella rhossiliensis TaxID=111463 RepID=A0A9P8SG56_9HYPO|nr:c2H2 type zinc-finger (2 copies) domain-containing protein [Hirsutella rhossiliensis]KAH0961638.1 c2H2 type zinc-finger (2 copies) domain-containing protein [Hirsutella rhossiliensis]